MESKKVHKEPKNKDALVSQADFVSLKRSNKKPVIKQRKNNTMPKPEKEKRYILFLGNLPFTANKEQIYAHFKSLGKDRIKDIRLLTKKGTNQSRGAAFLELTDFSTFNVRSTSFTTLISFTESSRIASQHFRRTKDYSGAHIWRRGE